MKSSNQIVIEELVGESAQSPPVIIETTESPEIITPPQATPEIVTTEPEAATSPGQRERYTYSHWDHICVLYDRATTSETLNSGGDRGWQLTSLGMMESSYVMCFKRPQIGAVRVPLK